MGRFEDMVSDFEELDADEKKQLVYKLTQRTNHEEVKQLQYQLEKAASTAEKIAIRNRIHTLTVK